MTLEPIRVGVVGAGYMGTNFARLTGPSALRAGWHR